MPQNMRSYSLRQWLSHSENTTGGLWEQFKETWFIVCRRSDSPLISLKRKHPSPHVTTGWEVAGDYIYTTPGDQDADSQMLTLKVPGYRSEGSRTRARLTRRGIYRLLFGSLPQSVSKAGENSELSRITFVFETTCSANCTFSFLAVRVCGGVNL